MFKLKHFITYLHELNIFGVIAFYTFLPPLKNHYTFDSSLLADEC